MISKIDFIEIASDLRTIDAGMVDCDLAWWSDRSKKESDVHQHPPYDWRERQYKRRALNNKNVSDSARGYMISNIIKYVQNGYPPYLTNAVTSWLRL
jgi:hypothetical protein